MSGGASPKRRGDAFERAVVDFLRTHGHPYAERAYGAGRPDDRGDIDGLVGWIIQCRAVQRLALAEALSDAEAQRPDRMHYAAAILKRRSHGVGSSYVVMSLETFAAIASDHPTPTPRSTRP